MSKANPRKIDYNQDRVVDSADDMLAVQDRNKDGRVTTKEKLKYAQQQASTTQEITVDPRTGKQTIKTIGAPPTIEPTISASEMGFSEPFLRAHPDVKQAIDLAIKNGWQQEQLNRYIETQTEFGRSTSDAEAQFDIEIAGNKAEDWQKKVSDRAARLKQEAMALGTPLSDQEATDYARRAVRSGLTEQDTLAFLAQKFAMPGAGAAGGRQMTPSGQAATMIDSIKEMARSYGITVTNEFIQRKVREGLQQGSGWQSWLEGQRNLFREQAKMLYPQVADKFDQFTLGEMVQPYLNDASDLLGINISQMNYSDPMWTAPLNGPNGPLNRDEWIRVLRTDPKYGFDRTTKARQEYMNLADDLLAAFGMA